MDKKTEDIMQELQKIMRDIFELQELQISRELSSNDLEAWDSYTHIHLISATEKKFKVKFSMNEIIRFRSVGDFVDVLSEKM